MLTPYTTDGSSSNPLLNTQDYKLQQIYVPPLPVTEDDLPFLLTIEDEPPLPVTEDDLPFLLTIEDEPPLPVTEDDLPFLLTIEGESPLPVTEDDLPFLLTIEDEPPLPVTIGCPLTMMILPYAIQVAL